MKTLIDIDKKLLEKVKGLSESPTYRAAVQAALEEYVRATKRAELRRMLGNTPGFKLTLKEFHHLRHGR